MGPKTHEQPCTALWCASGAGVDARAPGEAHRTIQGLGPVEESADELAQPPALIGGKYRVLRRLGAGGMAAVYQAENTWTGRIVAVKVLHPQLARTDEIVRRFRLEAQSAVKIVHPNIVDVLDMGQEPDDGALYIVQEFLTGMSLGDLLAHTGRLSLAETLGVMLPIMDAVAAVHARGVVHRDIKPDNIFLARAPTGRIVPKLIDFGVSKTLGDSERFSRLTMEGLTVGTPHYMSPEQARGEPSIDARTDVWSLGAVLYQLLAGRCPYEGTDGQKVVQQVVEEAPPPLVALVPDLPRPIADAIHRALEPDRGRRVPSVEDLRRDLVTCAAALGVRPTVPALPTGSVDGVAPLEVRASVPPSAPPAPEGATSPPRPMRRAPFRRGAVVAALGALLALASVTPSVVRALGRYPDGAPPPAAQKSGAGASSGPAPELVAPEPVAPELVAPEPVAPELVAPEPVAPELVAPEPVAPELVAPEPVAPELVAPEPVAPEIVAPELVAPEAVAPDPPASLGVSEAAPARPARAAPRHYRRRRAVGRGQTPVARRRARATALGATATATASAEPASRPEPVLRRRRVPIE